MGKYKKFRCRKVKSKLADIKKNRMVANINIFNLLNENRDFVGLLTDIENGNGVSNSIEKYLKEHINLKEIMSTNLSIT